MSFDREKAREKIRYWYGSTPPELDGHRGLLDALAGCVTDEPPTIDRDALIFKLWEAYGSVPSGLIDRILALLGPDPRIAKLDALCVEAIEWQEIDPPMVLVQDVRAILQGES